MRRRMMYAQAVTMYLYSLRKNGLALHEGIQALGKEQAPWTNDRPVEARPERYERLIRGHWVGYEVLENGETIRIIYIQAV